MKYIAQVGALLLAAALLAGCGASTRSTPTATPGETVFIPVLAASELVVGPNRFPIGVLRNGTPINEPDLTLRLRFFYLDGGDRNTPRSEANAVYRGQGLPVGLYVAYPTLDAAGSWRVEVTIPRAGGEPQVTNMRVDVLATARVPNVGDKAIPSRNLTARDVPELKQLTSDFQPDPDLYQLTIADAIAAKKPFLISFSTPGYCQTAVCGPNIQVIKKLKEELKGQVNFIHVEVYPYPFGESFQAQKRVPAMDEWKLITEPWTFLVDSEGIIQARYEGGLTFAELEPALKQLAAGQL